MFLAWKKSENESKNGSKITKKRFRATPHQRVEKNTLQTQKMNPKSWKTRGFFTFFSPSLAGAATNKSIPYCFLQCFVKASVTTYQPPPQVNLNLSGLMPSGWSRPLHLRCGRISRYSVYLRGTQRSQAAWLRSPYLLATSFKQPKRPCRPWWLPYPASGAGWMQGVNYLSPAGPQPGSWIFRVPFIPFDRLHGAQIFTHFASPSHGQKYYRKMICG